MFKIYVIEDCNGLKYVGQTKQKLNTRLSGHIRDKYDNNLNYNIRSSLLDLDDCEMRCIDIADSKEEAKELEWFYMNSIDCVNINKGNFNKKESTKIYREKK